MMRPLLALALTAPLAACLPSDPVDEIPAAMQGRWGIVPADCDPARDDNKGLMEVGGHTLSFYESRAMLDRLTTRNVDHVQGSFLFEGEGMAWTRVVTLTLTEDGLRKRETAPDRSAEPFEQDYARCPEGAV